MKQFMLPLLMVASLSYATSKSYDVVPYRDCIAVETLGTRGVTQYVRNTLDSLSAISVWIGDTFDTSSFNVEVRDSATPSAQNRLQRPAGSRGEVLGLAGLPTDQGRGARPRPDVQGRRDPAVGRGDFVRV